MYVCMHECIKRKKDVMYTYHLKNLRYKKGFKTFFEPLSQYHTKTHPICVKQHLNKIIPTELNAQTVSHVCRTESGTQTTLLNPERDPILNPDRDFDNEIGLMSRRQQLTWDKKTGGLLQA